MSEAVRVEVVRDFDAAWRELEPMYVALAASQQPFTGEELQPGWRDVQRAALRQYGDDGFIVIARLDGRAVGFADASIRRDPGLFGVDVGFLNSAYVEPEWRGRGIGRRLLESIESWCRERGVQRLDLTVATANVDGIAAWRALGFGDHALRLSKRVE